MKDSYVMSPIFKYLFVGMKTISEARIDVFRRSFTPGMDFAGKARLREAGVCVDLPDLGINRSNRTINDMLYGGDTIPSIIYVKIDTNDPANNNIDLWVGR